MSPAMRLIKPVAVAALVFSLSGMPATAAQFVVVVSAKNPVKTLSRNQVVDIFLGKTTQFPNGEQAIPIDQPEGTPVRDEFYATVSGKSAAQLKAHWSKIIFTGRGLPPAEVQNSNKLKQTLAENPAAIGYIDQRDLDNSVRALNISP